MAINSVIIVAAGRGERMGLPINKIFIPLDQTPLIIHTIERFHSVDAIDEIILVINQSDRDKIKALIKEYQFIESIKIAIGGATRVHSVANGLKLVSDEADNVLVHDAARPFVTAEIILNTIAALKDSQAVIVATSSIDTIKLVQSETVIKTLDRNHIYAVQTPQGFHKETIELMYKHAIDSDELYTDDASIAESLNYSVKIITGSTLNFKLTTPQDVDLANAIMLMKKLKEM